MSDHEPISVAEALAILAAHPLKRSITSIPLQEAVGKVLAEDMHADRDFPPFDRVAMDGYAIQAPDTSELPFVTKEVETVQHAGEAPVQLHNESGAIQIMTGACLPYNTNCIIPIEQTVKLDHSTIKAFPPYIKGQHIHRQAADVQKGDIVLKHHTVLRPHHLSILAGIGCDNVPAFAKPKVVFVSTGNELVDVQEQPLPHQIRKSNPYQIAGFLAKHGISLDLVHCHDDKQAVEQTLQNAFEQYDIVLTSGGVSMGEKDYIPQVLSDLGATLHFHKVSQKPGKPLLFASYQNKVLFGLPGNPLSTLVSCMKYVMPYVGLPLPQWSMPLAHTPGYKPMAKHRFIPVLVEHNLVRPIVFQGSGDFTSIAPAQGFAELLPNQPYDDGDMVNVIWLL